MRESEYEVRKSAVKGAILFIDEINPDKLN